MAPDPSKPAKPPAFLRAGLLPGLLGFRQLCQLLVFLRRYAGEEARRCVVPRLLRLVHLAPEIGVVGGVAADLP